MPHLRSGRPPNCKNSKSWNYYKHWFWKKTAKAGKLYLILPTTVMKLKQCPTHFSQCWISCRNQSFDLLWKFAMQIKWLASTWNATLDWNGLMPLSLREKCPYSEFFRSVFSRIWTEYGEILCISPNTDKLRIRALQAVKIYLIQVLLVLGWSLLGWQLK